jgi:hypothetical protein
MAEASNPRVVDYAIMGCITLALVLRETVPRRGYYGVWPNPATWSPGAWALAVFCAQAVFHSHCESVERMMSATFSNFILIQAVTLLALPWDTWKWLKGLLTWETIPEDTPLVQDPTGHEYSHLRSTYLLRRMALFMPQQSHVV